MGLVTCNVHFRCFWSPEKKSKKRHLPKNWLSSPRPCCRIGSNSWEQTTPSPNSGPWTSIGILAPPADATSRSAWASCGDWTQPLVCLRRAIRLPDCPSSSPRFHQGPTRPDLRILHWWGSHISYRYRWFLQLCGYQGIALHERKIFLLR